MKVIRNKYLPFGRKYYAINLFGVIFAKGPCDKFTINHESIHTSQMREMGYVFFYIWYGLEWLLKLGIYRDAFAAYKNLSFEREAYANERNLNYRNNRPPYAFLKYLRVK